MSFQIERTRPVNENTPALRHIIMKFQHLIQRFILQAPEEKNNWSVQKNQESDWPCFSVTLESRRH